MENKPHWLDQPRHIKLLWRTFLAVLALTVLAQLVITLHPHFAIEGVFGFAAWYGFGTCVLMIVVAKALGLWLKRPDTYYGEPPGPPGDVAPPEWAQRKSGRPGVSFDKPHG